MMRRTLVPQSQIRSVAPMGVVPKRPKQLNGADKIHYTQNCITRPQCTIIYTETTKYNVWVVRLNLHYSGYPLKKKIIRHVDSTKFYALLHINDSKKYRGTTWRP